MVRLKRTIFKFALPRMRSALNQIRRCCRLYNSSPEIVVSRRPLHLKGAGANRLITHADGMGKSHGQSWYMRPWQEAESFRALEWVSVSRNGSSPTSSFGSNYSSSSQSETHSSISHTLLCIARFMRISN